MKTFISPKPLSSAVGQSFSQVSVSDYLEGTIQEHTSKFGTKVRFFPKNPTNPKFPEHCTLSSESLEIIEGQTLPLNVVCRTTTDTFNNKQFTIATILSIEEIVAMKHDLANYQILPS